MHAYIQWDGSRGTQAFYLSAPEAEAGKSEFKDSLDYKASL